MMLAPVILWSPVVAHTAALVITLTGKNNRRNTMRVVRDLIGGNKPAPIDIHYNGDADIDSTTLRYRGSLCKFMDFTGDVDHGTNFVTWAEDATTNENIAGILEEEQPITGNYLPDDASFGLVTRKMTPVFSSTVIEAEYAQADPAGTAIYDTGASAAAASTTFTPASLTTADKGIGAWIWMINGAAAGELHYVIDDDATDLTLATAMVNAVVAADDFLFIQPAVGLRQVDFDAHLVNIKSETDSAANLDYIIGLRTLISAPGWPKQPLARDSHDGLVIANAKFFHEFIIPGGVAGIGNAYAGGKFS
jgi:hypothetical protein